MVFCICKKVRDSHHHAKFNFKQKFDIIKWFCFFFIIISIHTSLKVDASVGFRNGQSENRKFQLAADLVRQQGLFVFY